VLTFTHIARSVRDGQVEGVNVMRTVDAAGGVDVGNGEAGIAAELAVRCPCGMGLECCLHMDAYTHAEMVRLRGEVKMLRRREGEVRDRAYRELEHRYLTAGPGWGITALVACVAGVLGWLVATWVMA
jgi:hypothetical protein